MTAILTTKNTEPIARSIAVNMEFRIAGFQFLYILPTSAQTTTKYGTNMYRTHLSRKKMSMVNQKTSSHVRMTRETVLAMLCSSLAV